jgi:hypothetical protein
VLTGARTLTPSTHPTPPTLAAPTPHTAQQQTAVERIKMHLRAIVILVKPNGWCTAQVTHAHGEAQAYDTIAIQAKYGLRVGNTIVAKVSRNSKGTETWFATFAEEFKPRVSEVYGREGTYVGRALQALKRSSLTRSHCMARMHAIACLHATTTHSSRDMCSHPLTQRAPMTRAQHIHLGTCVHTH